MDWKTRTTTLVLFGLLITGCGGDGDGGGGSRISLTPILTAGEGSGATSAGLTAATSGTTLSAIMMDLGALPLDLGLIPPPTSSLGVESLAMTSLSKRADSLAGRSPRNSQLIQMARNVAHPPVIEGWPGPLTGARDGARTTLAQPIIQSCAISGGVTFSGSFNNMTGDLHLDVNFDHCRVVDDISMEGEEFNGPMTVDGMIGSLSVNLVITMGDGQTDFTSITYNDSSFTSPPVLVFTAHLLTFTQRLAVNSDLTTLRYTVAANGSAKFDDPSTSVSIDFTSFTDNGTGIFTPDLISPTAMTLTDTLNGSFTESWADPNSPHFVAVTFINFSTQVNDSMPDDSYTLSYNGTVTVLFDPDADCAIEGTFTYRTETPLLFTDGAASCPLEGHVVINGNTDVVFNNGGVDVTVGSDTIHFASCDEAIAYCRL